MNKLILACIFLTLSSFASAEEPTNEEICGAFSTWVYAVIMKKIEGVPEERVLPVLQKENGLIQPEFAIELRKIIMSIYSPQMPVITSAADAAHIVTEFNKQCVEDLNAKRN